MTRFVLARALLAGTCIMSSAPALADDYAEREPIVVVSIKQPAGSVLDYPGSIGVIDRQELDGRQVQDLSTLSYAAPNVSLDPIGTFRGVANFAIRGLGINSSIPSIDPAVGLFVDGVYMGVNAGTVFDALDVTRVELLRGPQGVAFGRNTTGGAVLVTTGEPTREWEGHARLTFETPVDDGRGAPLGTGRVIVSGPVSDTLGVRLAALHSSDGGYFRNRFDGSDFGAAETTVLRGALAWRPADRFELMLKGEWNRSNGDGATTHNNGQNARDSFDLSVNQPGFYHSRAKLVSARAQYRLSDDSALTNIFGWRKYDLRTRNDIDSSPVKIFESDTGTAQEQWSDEFYYAGRHGALDLTLGAYWFHQKVGYDENRDLTALGAPVSYGGGRQKHDVYALYGQASYEVAAALSLTAGLRWSREEKEAAITYVRARAACSAIAGTCPTTGTNPASGENNGLTDTRAWTNLSPRVAVDYALSGTTHAYASWTRGYRSGGYNLRITQPAAFEEVSAALGSPAFDEERVDSFEVGFKHAGPRASVNAALFWSTVDNLQREINVPSLTSGLAQSVYNTADARIRGGEIEAEVVAAEGLRLSANAGYTDAEYRRVFFDINSDGVVDSADRALKLPRAPKWTWGLGAVWSTDVSDNANLTARANFQHRSRYAYTDNNWGYNAASDRLDASLAVGLGEPAITVTLYGRNLLDEVQFGGDTQLPFAGGAHSDGNNRPFDPHPAAGTFSPVFKGRVLGVEVAMDF